MLERLRRARKLRHEYGYWSGRHAQGGRLEDGIPFYRWLFCEHFGVGEAFYAGKRILDVGCGPRGSLEWAGGAAERVGLDPLADRYAGLHARPHAMRYVRGAAERMPFDDAHFHVVATINSLDHVDDLDAALREIARVTAPGGTWLLVVDVAHGPTVTEPQRLEWDLLDALAPDWELVERRAFARPSDNLYDNLRAARPHEGGPGVLSAVLSRR